MKSKEAVDRLDPKKWADTQPAERLALLEEVRANLKAFGDELAAADTQMKNELMGEDLFGDPTSKIGTVVPMANTVTAAIEGNTQRVRIVDHIARVTAGWFGMGPDQRRKFTSIGR